MNKVEFTAAETKSHSADNKVDNVSLSSVSDF